MWHPFTHPSYNPDNQLQADQAAPPLWHWWCRWGWRQGRLRRRGCGRWWWGGWWGGHRDAFRGGRLAKKPVAAEITKGGFNLEIPIGNKIHLETNMDAVNLKLVWMVGGDLDRLWFFLTWCRDGRRLWFSPPSLHWCWTHCSPPDFFKMCKLFGDTRFMARSR